MGAFGEAEHEGWSSYSPKMALQGGQMGTLYTRHLWCLNVDSKLNLRINMMSNQIHFPMITSNFKKISS